MCDEKLIRHVTDSSKFKDASHLYYRFIEDDDESSMLSATAAGNGSLPPILGQGGCKWSFCPHTAHNSYILDIGLAEEIETSVAGRDLETRLSSFEKLRNRVKEEMAENAPNWTLSQSQKVGETLISVFQRKRPRGDFKNLKMTGMVGESPREWIKGILGFERRKQWENMFEDGVVVEGIDLGEDFSLLDDEESDDEEGFFGDNKGKKTTNEEINNGNSNNANGDKAVSTDTSSNVVSHVTAEDPRSKADDVVSFLETVELASIPHGMSIALLNDPDRQHALSHLRKQMMLANPQECMLCHNAFKTPADIRFCPCCAMVSCSTCVRKRVFEIVSRQVVSVCFYCYDYSSRIHHPAGTEQAKKKAATEAAGNGSGNNTPGGNKKGDGMEDSLNMRHGLSIGVNNVADALLMATQGTTLETDDDKDAITTTKKNDKKIKKNNSRSLLVGLEEVWDEEEGDLHTARNTIASSTSKDSALVSVFSTNAGDGVSPDGEQDGIIDEMFEDNEFMEVFEHEDDALSTQTPEQLRISQLGDGIGREIDESDTSLGPVPATSIANQIGFGKSASGYARCKKCGTVTPKDIEAIEAHINTCPAVAASKNEDSNKGSGPLTVNTGQDDAIEHQEELDALSKYQQSFSYQAPSSLLGAMEANDGGENNMSELPTSPTVTYTVGDKTFRSKDIRKYGTRIIYRTARAHQSNVFNFRPREVCALQDSFVDDEGTCYVYEISVRHCDVRGSPGYVTADVLMHSFAATPIKDSRGNDTGASSITIISQVDTRAKGPGQLFLSLMAENPDTVGIPRKEDLAKELKASGNLQNILKKTKEGADSGDNDEEEKKGENIASLEDFELLAVLGRGGFGKVMQVRHRPTDMVYAMKILRKNELVRRRQVERTQTERTILAAVRHPFIVCLHYAFQNQAKLYMVMDFVQGGDFFTLMRKYRRLPEEWVRIYVGEIALALQHLHDMDVVYRDLKPENILLCSDGHLKLTDFGLSRFFETRPPNPEDMIGEDADVVTRSFCGTEQYMSPEMLLQQGHNFRMDWWCLGLLMHEMLSAKHPFHGPSHYETLKNMVTKQPTIDQRVSHNAAAVVRSLLIKNPRSRMCCQKGCDELKSLAFFADINWEDLYNKNISLSHIPNVKDETDISFFETTFTREAPVDSLASEASIKKPAEKKKTGGLLSYFMGTSSKKEEREKSVNDSFRDFGFVKQATEAEASNGNGEEEEALGLGEMSSPTRDSPPGGSSFTPSVPIKSKK